MTTQMTKALTELRIPERNPRNWGSAVMRTCDFCSQWALTVQHEDGGSICASCCDAEYTADLRSALVMAIEHAEAKDKRIAEQSMLLEGSDAILADYAETLGCAGDTDSILAAIVALQSRAESAEQALLERQKVAELESSSITVTLPEPDCAADFVLPVAVYTQETIIDCLASRRINIQIQGGE